MGLEDIGSSFGLGSFDMAAIISKFWFFFMLFVILLMIGMAAGLFYFLYQKKKNPKETKKIGWWEEINGNLQPGKMEDAEEIIIPGTTLRVFYVKARDLWLPRFSRGITSNLFYVLLTPTKQMINFTLRSISEDLKKAKLDYDHTDMLWAAENTREFIKRNYKDKSVKWWVAYQGVITTAAYLLLITFSFIMILFFLRGVISDIGDVARTLSAVTKELAAQTQTSGVANA